MADPNSAHVPYNETEFYVGLGLAISSSAFIGSSFIIKKRALLRLNRDGCLRAGSGGYGYLRDWLWWTGLVTMGVGESANFAAYAFAPASLVTPLGALSVLVAAVLAPYFLQEKLNLLGKLGCFLCIVGSTTIVIHAPKEEEIENVGVLVEKMQEPAVVVYIAAVLALCLVVGLHLGPRCGHRNVAVYVLLCSSIGSLSVMACKGLGLALRGALSFSQPNGSDARLAAGFLAVVLVCITVQMNYLNKSLDLFNTGIVTPVYYVFFTTFVIVASSILFREWEGMSANDILGSFCGFFTIVVAIILLNAFRDLDISLSDLHGIMKPKKIMMMESKRLLHNSTDHLIQSRNPHSYGMSPSMTV